MTTRRKFLKIGAAAAALAPWRVGAAANGDAAFHALLGQLPAEPAADETPAGADAARLRQSQALRELLVFNPTPLSFGARLDFDGIVEGLALEVALRTKFPIGTTGETVSPYVVSQRIGSYLSPDSATAANIEGETARLQADAAAGIVPPDFIVDATLAKLKAARAAAPAALAAALEAQIAALKIIAARSTHDAGVWRLRDGDAHYALALRIGTSLSIAPQAAHDEGLRQVRELTAQADALLRRQGLTRGSVGARLHGLGQDARYLYSDDDAGRAQAVAQMNTRLARVRGELGRAFTGLSPGAVSVVRAGPGKIGYRTAPSYDGSKPGVYYVDLRDIKRRPSWSLPTVVHHETLPGHLLQLPLQEHASPPALRLRYTPNAFFEGWAFYAEQLADELGLLAGDDLARLGYLQSLLVRAGRLVVDTGIHFKRWSREEAIARFFAIAGDAPDSFENEVDRIVVQPGFTAGPALGRMTILKLRAQSRRGLTAFHAALLKRGLMRLSLVERAMRNWRS